MKSSHFRRADLSLLEDIVLQKGTLLNLVDVTLPTTWTVSKPTEKEQVPFSTLAQNVQMKFAFALIHSSFYQVLLMLDLLRLENVCTYL